MEQIKLSEIVHIRTGYTQRGFKVSKDKGEYFLIKPSDFKEEYFYIENSNKVSETELRKTQTHQLKNNEILIVNKGSSISSYLYKNDGNKYIATSSFFVLTVASSNVIPEYLHWYLNQEVTKQQIESFSSGSVIKTFTKKNLSTLPIPIPELLKQQEIVDFHNAVLEEKKKLKLFILNTESIYQVQSEKYLNDLK